MKKLLAATAAVAALSFTPAYALEVENQDGVEHVIVIVDANENVDHKVIAPGASLKGLCGSVCQVHIEADDGSYTAVTFEDKAVIKDRRLMMKPRG